MITQEYKQGEHTIKIETAENIEDAKENGFPSGVFSKYYVNGKRIDNYMAMIRFIVDESKKNKSKLIPNKKQIEKLRIEMLKKQTESINKYIDDMTAQYKAMNIPKETLEMVLEKVKKLDPVTNVRIAK
jgi:hypothetical protein